MQLAKEKGEKRIMNRDPTDREKSACTSLRYATGMRNSDWMGAFCRVLLYNMQIKRDRGKKA